LRPEHLLGAVVLGALGVRRKNRRRVVRFLSGGNRSLVTGGTLLTAAGLAWGVYEAATRSSSGPGGAAGVPPPHGPAPALPPPLPGSPGAPPAVTPEALRLVRLAVAAARADGELGASEREAILAQARAVGAEAAVAPELERPQPLAAIVAGVADASEREELYALAFAIVRADESVSGGERIWLAQLAHQLGLDPPATQRIETEVAAGIDAEPE